MKPSHISICKNIRSKASLLGLSTLITLSTVSAATAQSLINPSFEENNVQTLQGLGGGQVIEGSGSGNPGYVVVTANNINGWDTTASNNGIEIWQSGFSPGGNTVNVANPANGTQFVEINATEAASLFQDLPIAASGGDTQLYFDFWHRARANGLPQVNAIRLTITDLGANAAVGGGDDIELFSKVFATQLTADLGANQGWANYSNIPSSTDGLGGITAAAGVARPIRFSYTALTGTFTADIYKTTGTTPTTTLSTSVTTTNVNTFGNFLDNANFSTDPTFPPAAVPFDFSPNLGIGILGGLYLGNRVLKSWKKSKDTNA